MAATGFALVNNLVSGGGSGSGDVVGPASATSGDVAIFDGSSGKLLKDTGVSFPGGVLPAANGGTGNADAFNADGTLGVVYGGTGIVLSSIYGHTGNVLVTGLNIEYRNPGLGTGTSYSVEITGVKGLLEGGLLPISPGTAHSIGFVITVRHQAGSGYGTVLIDGDDTNASATFGYGIYIKDLSATTFKLSYFGSAEHLNSTTLNVGTRYYVVLTVKTDNTATWYVNGAADGTFTWADTFSFSELFTNAGNETLFADFLSDLAYYPVTLSSGQVSTQYGLRSGAASTYRAQIVTDGASNYWEMQEASGDFLDSVGVITINNVQSVTTVNNGPVGTVLASTGTYAPSFQYPRTLKVVTPVSDATSFTPNSSTTDIVYQPNTQSAGTLTVNNDAGTPVNGQSLLIKIKSTNVQTFAWDTGYVGGTVALPTATTGGGKIDYFAFMYDSVNSKWDYIGTAAGF